MHDDFRYIEFHVSYVTCWLDKSFRNVIEKGRGTWRHANEVAWGVAWRGQYVVLKDFSRLPGFSLPDDRFASASSVRKENSEGESKVILSSIHVHMYGSAGVCEMNRIYHNTYLVKSKDGHKHPTYKRCRVRLPSSAFVQPHIKVLSPLLCCNPTKKWP